MNKKIIIIILTSTILLIALLLVLAAYRTKTGSDISSTNTFIVPTNSPVDRRGNNIKSNLTSTPLPTLPPEQQNNISTFKNFLPYDSQALGIDYSQLTNRIYIEKKNGTADEELRKFLEKNNLSDVYRNFPNLFFIISAGMGPTLNEENEILTELSVQLSQTLDAPSPTSNPNDPSEQALPMINVFKSLMGYNTTLLPYSPTTHAQPAQQTTTSTSQSDSSAQQSTYKPTAYIQPLSPAYKQNVQYDWGNYQCLGREQPGTRAIHLYVNSHWGGGDHSSLNCNMSNGLYSIHATGRAVDSYFYVGDKLQQGNATFGWLLTNAQNIGIQYIKYWRVQWSAGKLGLHCVTDAQQQASHSTHIHYELNWPGAKQQTPYFTAGVNKPSAITINQEVCPIVK